jgi:hypothetical protein
MESKKHPTCKGLGKKQRDVIRRMCKDGLKISCIDHPYGNTNDLCDEEGDNTYEAFSYGFVHRLVKRNLFTTRCHRPSIDVHITEFRMKKELIEETLLIIGTT